MIMVSACLCGDECKYSGGHNRNEKVVALSQKEEVIKICPEVFGGLPTPRKPSEIQGGSAKDVLLGKAKIINNAGEDVTDAFICGAKESLALAKKYNIKKAILKANSPSCGCGKVYNGQFNGQLIEGNGLTTELLLQAGIEIKTEKDL